MKQENTKVIIGIVAKHNPYNKNCEKIYITDATKQAIFDNGAIAIGILPTELPVNYKGDTHNWEDNLTKTEKENLISQLNLCDGIILQGGIEMDNYEFIVAKYCYDHNIPILGICAGQNAIAVVLGGATRKVSNPEKHNVSRDYVHNIRIKKNSKFYSIIGQEQIRVNSLHTNTIDTCPQLEKVAFCEDSYVEVIEAKDKDFYMGVRFHPEDLYHKDDRVNNIFKSFITTCQNRK